MVLTKNLITGVAMTIAMLLVLAAASIVYAGPTDNTGFVTVPSVAKDAESPACAGTDADPCSGMGASLDGRTTANEGTP